MLRLHCTTYHYPAARTPALHDLDLELPHGAVVGLVGPNEAGKSTLCLVAAGLAPSVAGGQLDGLLEIDGEPMTGRRPAEVAQRVGLGLADPRAQLSGICGTVFEEVALGPMDLGLPSAQTIARVEAAADAVGIGALLLRHPGGLSGGETQLVAIASLLAMEPSHLILDEPTSQLDPLGARLVAEALHGLAHRGLALLIAEHRTDLLDGLCDTVLVIEAGTLVGRGPAAEVLAEPGLAAAGVDPPSRLRLGRACAAAGLTVDPEAIRTALGGWPHP